jgi:hypothetical protein
MASASRPPGLGMWQVGHDRTGQKPSFFLGAIEVTNGRSGQTLRFNCDCWIKGTGSVIELSK